MGKKILNNIFFLSVVKKANTIIFGMIATIFLNRALGPTLKGEYATIINVISTLTNILYLGISTIYPNYVRKKEQWTYSTFVGLVFAQGIVYSGITLIFSIVFLSKAYFLYGMTIVCAVMSMQILQMSIVNDFKNGAIANILSVSTNALFMFIMWWSSVKSVYFAVLIFLVKELSIVIFSFSYIRKSFKWSDMEPKHWFGIVANGFIPMVTNLMIVLNYKVDVIILQVLNVDFYQIGLYSTGLALAEYGWIISDVFKDVLIKKTSSADNVDSVAFCLRVSSTALLIIGAILLVSSRFILTLLYGKAYSDAWLVTDIIFLGVFAMSYCKLLMPLYLANGRWKLCFCVLSSAAGVNITTNLLLIPTWGIYGAAITTIVSYSYAGFVLSAIFIKNYKIRIKDIVLIERNDVKRFVNVLKLLKSNK